MRFTRTFVTLILISTSVLLAGCNSFRVSEDDVNKEVAKLLAQPQENHIKFTLDSNTLNLDLVVTSAHIDFTERDGGLVLVDMISKMTGTLTAFGQTFSLSARVNPSFESGVRIEEDRLYLVAPKITQIEVEGSSFNDKMLRSTLGSLHDDFEKALVQYFDEHPVYVLNHSPFEKTAASLVKDIIIKEDSLELSIF
ncbi:MAG: DUF1439 domain-containing protein [Gammaproteobacteria bacterium]|jgi:predicted small secreted protein|nr:DUF1439 domain-containing protein [Gammaproteobacteria bacterium]MBU1465344.1 DUF1439 domain-containing protein [Gammaproteobacteria bacterium]MBU2023585.1 DUF1439 domain-containing protein [Gammaproteobacteria bacterium]MBU2237364.1 DUF1439 domain-containing protein [Gammaproteobacteria bacterium]MBU2319156.1 DUF1439 domain-containing protein [Gammaproteobacteria bacterium]